MKDPLDCQAFADTDTFRMVIANVRSVLVVDDDELARSRLELLLSQLGLDVVTVSSAQEARGAMKAVVFPVVLIDRTLEDGDGLSLLAELRMKYARHRVFLMLLSALDSPEDIAEGMGAGADDYLSKRTSDAELLERVRTAVRLVQLNAAR